MQRARLAAAGAVLAAASVTVAGALTPPSVVQLDGTRSNCYTVTGTNVTACLPDILVAGHPKCGTSAVYALLQTHPQVMDTAIKEHCLVDETDVAGYLSQLPSPSDAAGKRVVSGCVNKMWNENMLRVFRPRTPIKIVYMVRDYADTMWASFNFWCILNFDAGCVPEAWTIEGVNYRSPELFHELLLAQSRGALTIIPTPSVNPLIDGFPFTGQIRSYEAMVGKDNVLVLDADDLQRNPRATWRKLAAFTGLSPEHTALRLFQSRRYNTQGKHGERGWQKHTKSSGHVAGLYAASGFRPMLNATRQIITQAWRRECVSLNEQYGLALQACRDGASP